MHGILAAAAVWAVIATGCSKDRDDGDGGGGGSPCGIFTGIVMRDVNGVPMGLEFDSTDWRTAAVWCAEAEALFDPLPALAWQVETDSLPVYVFPNPAVDEFRFVCLRDSTDYLDLRVVRQNMDVLVQADSMLAQQIAIDMSGFALADGEEIRVYYRIIHSDGTAHRGQGDVRRTQ